MKLLCTKIDEQGKRCSGDDTNNGKSPFHDTRVAILVCKPGKAFHINEFYISGQISPMGEVGFSLAMILSASYGIGVGIGGQIGVLAGAEGYVFGSMRAGEPSGDGYTVFGVAAPDSVTKE